MAGQEFAVGVERQAGTADDHEGPEQERGAAARNMAKPFRRYLGGNLGFAQGQLTGGEGHQTSGNRGTGFEGVQGLIRGYLGQLGRNPRRSRAVLIVTVESLASQPPCATPSTPSIPSSATPCATSPAA